MPKFRSGYSRKRKFHGNQFSRDAESKRRKASTTTGEHSSASAKKINLTESGRSKDRSKSQDTGIHGFRFVDMDILAAVMKKLPCKECAELELTLCEDDSNRKGCASSLSLQCSSCGWTEEFYTSSQVKHYYEVNRRFVYAMRSVGCGSTAAKRFCGIMNMPPPPRSSPYSNHNKALLKVVQEVAQETMTNAGREIKQIKPSSDNGLTQCGVSCDGTWQRRGFSSLNGCVTVISMDTGKCLDVEPLSKVCKKCKQHEDDKNTPENAAWKAEHAPNCKANHKGSAPAMETAGARRIFNRSIDVHALQYTEYFGDGDSKGFDEVKDTYLEDYDMEVKKKECVGHVQKRLGTALRKLKKEKKGLGGKGKLTNNTIDKLQNYYGIAIRSNKGDLAGMKKAIYASLMHCASSKDLPLHDHCPDGKESWCGFKRDKANKTNLFKPGPGLPKRIIAELKPIYLRLSNDDLLCKCLDGKTQNQNESLNGMIWCRLPKGVFVGSDLLKLGIYDAVSHFNVGAKAVINVLNKLGIKPGSYTEDACKDTDKLRVSKANYKAKEINKKRRKVIRGRKKKKEDTNEEKEGETYASGSF